MSGILQGGFNKSFQHGLIVHLARCEDFAKEASAELKPSDFSLGIHQAVWEVILEYLGAYRRLPPLNLYIVLLTRLIENQDGHYTSYVSNEEHPALIDLLHAIETTSGLAPEMYRGNIAQYVKWIRSMKVLGDNIRQVERGADPSVMASRLNEIGRTVDSAFSREALFTSITADPELPTHREDIISISTGLNKLDQLLDGGPRPGQLLQVTACQGVGKSNLLIHMAMAAAFTGYRSLMISLELLGWMFKHRYIAMTAAIPGSTIKKAVCDWDDDEIARLALLMSPGYPMYDRTQVAARAGVTQTVDQLEHIIAEWKEWVRKTYGRDEMLKCRHVSLDWLKYVVPSGCSPRTDLWERVMKSSEQLAAVSKRQDVVIWTANQGNKGASKKLVLEMGDTAFGFNTNDAIDTGIGAALTADSRVQPDDVDDDVVIGDRRLLMNVNKNRTGNLGSTTVYQAPTLRFFDSDAQYQAMRANLGRSMHDMMDHYKLNMPAATAKALVAKALTEKEAT